MLLQMTPHPPPPKTGPRAGPYRTTMFRRDFTRIQTQRNLPSLSKEPQVRPGREDPQESLVPDMSGPPQQEGPSSVAKKGEEFVAKPGDVEVRKDECEDKGVNKVNS